MYLATEKLAKLGNKNTEQTVELNLDSEFKLMRIAETKKL